jgi:Bacterial membrane protein YfhO
MHAVRTRPVSEAAALRADAGARRPARARRILPEVLVLPLLATAVSLPPLLRGDLIGRGEMPHEYSLYAFVGRALRAGHLPSWNPYTVSGNPALADPASNVFYPFTAPLLLLGSPAAALNAMFVLHVALAGLFMHLYLGSLGLPRPARFAGALVYMLSSFVGWRIFSGDIPRIATYAWIPLAFYVIEEITAGRRGLGAALLGGAVLAVQFFAGEPQAFTHACLAVLAYAAFRLAALARGGMPRPATLRAAVLLTVMLAAGAGLASVQVLPTYEDFQNSNRLAANGGFSTLGSIPPLGLISVLAPRFFGDETHGAWGELELGAHEFYPHAASLYCGFFTIVLAITALITRRDRWHVRFAAWLAVAVVWIALGKFGYLYRLAAYVPVIRSFRDIENINILLPVSAAVLAAFGFDRFLEADGAAAVWGRIRGWTAVTVGAGAALVSLSALYLRTHGLELFSLRYVRSAAADSVLFVAAAWVMSVLLIRARAKHREAPAWLTAFALGLLAADLVYTSGPLMAAGTPTARLAQGDAVTRYLAQDHSLYRVSGFFDRGPAFGVQDTGGEPSLLLTRYQAYTDVLQGRPADAPIRIEGPHGVDIRLGLDSTMLGLLNVKYSILRAQDQPAQRVQDPLGLVQVSPNDVVYRHPLVFPRAMAIGSYLVIPDSSSILAALDRAGVDPAAVVLLEEAPASGRGVLASGGGAAGHIPGSVAVASYGDNEVALDTHFLRAGFLVLNDLYYPAWQASIDGRPAPVYRANYLFRAVVVPAGRHRIRFVYRDRMLALGATISLFTAVCGLAALVRTRNR